MLLFIRVPFYVLLVFVGMCSVFWLFWLSYQYLQVAKWLARKTPLRKPNCGKGDRLHKAQAEEWFDCLGLFILSLFNCMICFSCPPPLHDILHTPVARYSLFVLKMPLNTKQANKQTNIILCSSFLNSTVKKLLILAYFCQSLRSDTIFDPRSTYKHADRARKLQL